MNDPHPPAGRVFYWFWFTRMVFAACAWILAIIFGAIVAVLISQMLKKSPSVGGVLGVIVGGAVVLGLIGWALRSMRSGKLVLLDDRVILPRLQLPPWCFLKPIEIPYNTVRRYGIGTVRVKSGVATVLMFEVPEDAFGQRTRRRRLSLIWYREQEEIMAHITRGVGREPERLESTALGDVRFKKE